jgi:tetratricopeptide (TPR) repeat protein
LGDVQGAIVDFNVVLRIDANYADAYKNRGLAHSRLGNKRSAIADLRKAASLYTEQGQIAAYKQVLNKIKEIE